MLKFFLSILRKKRGFFLIWGWLSFIVFVFYLSFIEIEEVFINVEVIYEKVVFVLFFNSFSSVF